VVEIVEQVLQKSKPMDTNPPKKLIAVIYWWWRTETHQTVSRIHYGMDTRIGYPNEHLAGDSDEEFSSPYMQQQ
jgi:cell division protein FtsA